MDRQKVTSGLLESVGYDPATDTLEVEFKHHKEDAPRKVYTYTPFTVDRYVEFMVAPSQGKYFLAKIKTDTTLTCKKVEESSEEKK